MEAFLASLDPLPDWEAALSDAPWAEEATPLRFRCLDASHAPGCARCTPPPAEADERSYELRGEGSTKDGERRCVAASTGAPRRLRAPEYSAIHSAR